MTLADVAHAGITVIFAMFAVMFVYIGLYDVFTVTLYDLAISAGMPLWLVNNLLLLYIWFPLVFLFCMLIWLVYTSTISGEHSWQ